MEAFKKEIKRLLKEMQENTIKYVEALRWKQINPLRKDMKRQFTQVREIIKTVQDLKTEIKAIKKTQTE